MMAVTIVLPSCGIGREQKYLGPGAPAATTNLGWHFLGWNSLYKMQFICLQNCPPDILSDRMRRLAAARVTDRPAEATRRQE
jgi:hypothetical protein